MGMEKRGYCPEPPELQTLSFQKHPLEKRGSRANSPFWSRRSWTEALFALVQLSLQAPAGKPQVKECPQNNVSYKILPPKKETLLTRRNCNKS
jgi:hypothetical protein